MLHIVWYIIVGFIVGWIARAIMPGAQHLGFIMTTLLGDRWLDRRWIDQPIVLQTGAGFGVSSGRLHHVDHRRDHSTIYLDKISDLTKVIGCSASFKYEANITPLFRVGCPASSAFGVVSAR
jgi:hypothetical protein